MKIGCPSGIGDWSWLLSRLYSVRDQIECWHVAEGWPNRTVPYIETCGFQAVYDPAVTYTTILRDMQINDWTTWEKIQKAADAGREQFLLAPNLHLEMGRRLEDWLPDLPPPEYHYPLAGTVIEQMKANLAVESLPRPLIGISCASYRGAEAWKTWTATQWIDCLRRIMAEGWNPVLLGGSWDDCTADVADELKVPNLVGKTSIGTAIEIQRRLDSYIGFSSGLGVIRTVMDKPVMMLWPAANPDQRPLSTSWVPPAMLESQRYVARPWMPVEEVWRPMKRFLERCGDELRGCGGGEVAARPVSSPATDGVGASRKVNPGVVVRGDHDA